MTAAGDHYEAFYADKLWSLVPEVYRAEDSDREGARGPLRELVERIGAQAAVLRRSIDRAWDDQSIETCDDWLIPYIGDLLATNLVASLDARGRRLDVANTIYYRRRAGTVAILEEIAHDVTGWDARVVEFFRRLSRTRHGFDPQIGLPADSDDPAGFAGLQSAEGLVGRRTGSQAGGFADLHSAYGAGQAQTAFDELFHSADFRAGQGRTGWHSISGLGVFLWRLYSFGVVKATPVACPTQGLFTFDPTGRRLPLFAASSRTKANAYGDHWVSPEEWQLPTPIRQQLYEAERANLYPGSLQVFRRAGLNDDPLDAGQVTVYPELGTFAVPPALQGDPLLASYHQGFPSTIGAGSFDRRSPDRQPSPVPAPEARVSGGGQLPAIAATGTVTIVDSLTYSPAGDVNGIRSLTLRAANRLRPLVQVPGPGPWTLAGAAPPQAPSLFLEGLYLSGADFVLRGRFDSVRLLCCTFDPGNSGQALNPPAVFASSVSGRPLRPVRIWVEGSVRSLEVDRCVLGPLRTRSGGDIETLTVRDSIVQGIRTEDFGNLVELEDPARLAVLLRDHADPLSAFVWAALRATTQQAVEDYLDKVVAAPTLAQVAAALTADLNGLIGGGASIYTPDRFAQVSLDAATLASAQAPPAGGADLLRLNRILLEEAYPAELADLALGTTAGAAELVRCTVLGPAGLHRLEASECILDDRVLVADRQHGCLRFSAWTTGSLLPRRYESVELPPAAPIFTSRDFGQPGYGQLLTDADRALIGGGPRPSLTEGGPSGSEMGAFAREMNAIKRRSLLIKYQEFMPLGMSPVIVDVT